MMLRRYLSNSIKTFPEDLLSGREIAHKKITFGNVVPDRYPFQSLYPVLRSDLRAPVVRFQRKMIILLRGICYSQKVIALHYHGIIRRIVEQVCSLDRIGKDIRTHTPVNIY